MSAAATMPQSERDWWLRALLVLIAPRAVFVALRDDSDDAAAARQEPVLAILLLAGIGGVLMTSVRGELVDDWEYDAILIAVWAFIAGGIYGAALYFVGGALVMLGASFAGGLGSYRRARHLLAFASVPFAVTLLVWPVRVALYGEDLFRTGGTDRGAGADVFAAIDLGVVAWSLALLVIGIRTVHGWSWQRSLAAAVVPALLPAAALARAYGLI